MLQAPPRPPEPDVGARARSGPSLEPRPPRRRRIRWREAWDRLPRWVLVSAATVVGLILLASLSFAPLVRARAAREAERRKLEIEIGRVYPGFFAVSLHDVKVRPRGVAGLEARLDALRVDLGATLAVREIAASGGGLFVEGEPDDVVERLRELRSGGRTSERSESSASALPVRAEKLALSWKLPSGGELSGSGLRASRNAEVIRLGCDRCSASHPAKEGSSDSNTVDLADADLELALDGAPRRVAAGLVTIGLVRPARSRAVPSPPPTTASHDLAPPPLPSARKRGAKAAAVPPAPVPPAPPEEPLLPLPDLHALRARIATMVTTLAGRLPEDARVEIGGLSARIDVGGEVVAFGPGTFSLTRKLDRIHVGFASASEPGGAPEPSGRAAPSDANDKGGTPLSLDADLPVGAGDITARLAGGPVSLAMLGVQEGTKGLTDVAHGTISGKGQLVLSAAGDALTFDGKVALRSINIEQPRLALDPLRGIELSVAARGVLTDSGKLRVDDAELDMGALHVKTHGVVEETPDHFALALAVDVAPASCQALLDSAPQGLLPVVRSARMGGSFGASMNLAFDTRTIEKLALDYKVDDQCWMLEVPRDLARERFSESFTYRTYHPDGTTDETTTGPGTPSWTDLDDISPFMIAAVLTTEDGAFYKHKGFNHAAIRSSVQANLKARRFVRGASTISMQLAKNLFLSRDKALSRKIEEVVLTDYLEQVFRKDDMMELYLNVVEFGPDVYGVTQAADYYFGRKPEELNLVECFFLASLLPSPIRYGKLRDKGEVSESWLRHLKALMEIAARNNKISSAELEEGLKESVVFVRPGEPRPEPRKPVTGRGRDHDDDAAWRPLD